MRSSISGFALAAVIGGAVLVSGQGPVGGPEVPTLAALKSLRGGQFKSVYRGGFTTLGDGGAGQYTWSAVNCTLNSGQGDDGGEVKPNAGSGCWLLDEEYPLNVRIWGKTSIPINFYVSTTGVDAGKCLDVGHPCATGAYAVTQSVKFNAEGGYEKINFGNGTHSGNIAVSGNGYGFGSSTPFVAASVSVPKLILAGNGSANTTILGIPVVGGQSYCYVILAQNYATIGIQDLAVQGDGTPGTCGQSDLYVERDATMYILGDVLLKSAGAYHVAMEDRAGMYINPGSPTTALTLQGTALNGINIDGKSLFWSDSTIAISGTPSFNGGAGAMFVGAYNSAFKLSGNPAVTSGSTISGRRFNLSGLSFMQVAHPPAAWPGTIGLASGGSVYQASDSSSCMGGAGGCPNVTGSSNLGAGGSYAVVAGSTPYAGSVQITMGANTLATGVIQLGFGYQLNAGVCMFNSFSAGTGAWNARAIGSTTSGFTTATGIAYTWDNNAVNLFNSLTYFSSYICTPQ